MNGVLQPADWPYSGGLRAGFGDRSSSAGEAAVVRVRQVHGTIVIRADALEPGVLHEVPGDALVVTKPGIIAAVATADCVPILLLEPEARWAAAVHAGWRGTLAGILSRTLDAAREDGIAPERMLAAIGPAIGGCCYEVGDDLAESFAVAGLPVTRAAGRAKATLDLRACNEQLLTSAGLRRSRIQFCGPCTRCHAETYHSYRADRDAAGRQLSWIGWTIQSP